MCAGIQITLRGTSGVCRRNPAERCRLTRRRRTPQRSSTLRLSRHCRRSPASGDGAQFVNELTLTASGAVVVVSTSDFGREERGDQ
jgi:hypothetical protein